jgi:hypothetical protein
MAIPWSRLVLIASLFAVGFFTPAAAAKYKFAFVTHGGPGNPFWNASPRRPYP